MSRETVSQALSGRLFAAEIAIDAALVQTASLVAMLPTARAEAYLSAVTGQRAFDTAAAAVAALTQARSNLVATHHTLAALARKMGLETLAVGPLDKPEDVPPNGGGVNKNLRKRVNKALPKTVNAC